MNAHELELLRRGQLPAEDVLAAARHLASCADCCRLSEELPIDEAAEKLRAAIAPAADEHPSMEELFAYADGIDRARIDEHLAECARCREDVADLLEEAASLRPRRSRVVPLVAAASIAAIVAVGSYWIVPEAEPMSPVARARRAAPPPSEWAALVDETLRRGTIDAPPVLRELRGEHDVLRNTRERSANDVRPAGEIVAADRPRFTWPAQNDAVYVVTIFAGDEEVVSSEPLRTTEWQPPAPLRRGVTYVWQVEVRQGDEISFLPAPPAPQARFRVVDAETLRQIDEARAKHPDDHLLAGILYARAGLQEESIEELLREPRGQRLLQSLGRW